MKKLLLCLLLVFQFLSGSYAQNARAYDLVIRNGMLYDGTGGKPRRADVGIKGDKISALGDLSKAKAATVVDAKAAPLRRASSTCSRTPRLR